jgi:site-specific DNA-methyltransferase (adenine-specific)
MMAARLVELHRVLKPSGSLYLHCDPTSSHYLKIVLDTIFNIQNFRSEIIWRRTNAKGLAFTRYASNHDLIFYYSKSEKFIWNPQYTEHNPEYLEKFYKYIEPETGRRYRLADLTNPNKNRPNLTYEFLGVNRVWRWTKERMQKALDDGIVVQSKPGAVPALKRYLDEQEGTPVDDIWSDILPIQAQAAERMGYPTQKPIALLERIIQASSNLAI